MTQAEREQLIEYVKVNSICDHNRINCELYSDEELLRLKKRVEWEEKRWLSPEVIKESAAA
jgi:hypothetical protein